MSAPYGNKNAEKWTLRKAVSLFKDAIALTQQKQEVKVTDKSGNITNIIEVYKYDFIGELAKELGTFHHIFSHLAKRFRSLQRLKNQLDSNIETNCYFNTKNGYIKEATGIVNLKSNWSWSDRQAIDQNNTGEITITRRLINGKS